ncbi:hypothetical protein E8E13_009102 [Curvularia kusanoi]|uniref:FAD-binding domain-containing protein n=1 Tax=Curvularia kusanoi TaxID=90978 RepID=A0A9P4TNC8_CURKU|nr:hypothetical protein E8E13_009102 [Curvularia kusanoi]
MPPLKILICGGGLAGNALAFWLTQQNHSVTVLERFPSLRLNGLQIDLRGHGVEAMKRMGLSAAFAAHAVPEQGLAFVNSAGKRKAWFPANTSGKGTQGFTTEHEIMRGDFCRVMVDAVGDRVKYVFGKTVRSFEQEERGVRVQYSDGGSGEFDIFVGADGQWSHTRAMMLGPGIPDPVTFLGLYIAYFTVPLQQGQGEEMKGEAYIATGKRVMFTRRHRADTIQVYLMSPILSGGMEGVKKGDVEGEKRAFKRDFSGAGWKADQLMKWMEASEDFYCERLSTVDCASWCDGRVVLLGDAGYCPSAATGMGTTSAIVGAYVLAGEIGKYCSGAGGSKEAVPAALKAYDERFRPFMDQVKEGINPETGYWTKIPTSQWGIAVLNFLLGLAAFLRLDAFAKLVSHEDVKGWSLPEYEGMDMRS